MNQQRCDLVRRLREKPIFRFEPSDTGALSKGTAVPVGIDSWYLVTARSDQLIAALKGECIVAELIRILQAKWFTPRQAPAPVPAL